MVLGHLLALLSAPGRGHAVAPVALGGGVVRGPLGAGLADLELLAGHDDLVLVVLARGAVPVALRN